VGLFPQRFIDDLKLQADIVAVVQEYVSLKRVGNTYKGLCPFHSEKTPSFHVNRDKGFFHCFGCGAGGDVFKFLELHEKIGFQDAARILAQRFGVAIPEPEEGTPGQARQDAQLREALLKAHEVAAAYFREQLAAPAGARARQQLRDRDVSAATIEQLGLGFAPAAREGLKLRLIDKGFSPDLLVQSGLLVRRDTGEVLDRFRNRLMIPICRDQGSVIAFGGRAMDAEQQPKYLNSPETAIYSKGRTLYGLNLTKHAVQKAGFAVLVEGYFDFAQVFQTQAAPAVASCGTALTSQQAQVLRRFTSRVVLSYDPDAAGQGAAARSCELLVAEGFDVNVLVLDKGEDPDTFIRRNGGEAYRSRLRTSQPYLEYLLDQAAAGVDFRHDDVRRQFLAKMLAVAARIPDPAARDQFADRIAHKARITEDVIRAEIRKAAVARKTTVGSGEHMPGLGHVRDSERALIWWIVNDPAAAVGAVQSLEDADLEGLATRQVLEVARGVQFGADNRIPSAVLQRLSTVDAQLVTRIASEKAPPALVVTECVKALRLIRWEREKALLQREIDRLQQLGAADHGDEINGLLARKTALAVRIQELR
jgi:DNA primase